MSVMIMKHSISETFRGSISNEEDVVTFLKEIEQHFAKNEKAEISNLLVRLVSIRYKRNKNIMEMSNIALKLKALKLGLSDDLLVHLVLISLPSQCSQFTLSYNTQKDKWTLNELISHCIKKKRGLSEKRQKVLIWQQPQRTKRGKRTTVKKL